MISVKVLKLAGETGLRKVDSVYELDQKTAENLESKGFVKILKKEPVKDLKEEKQVHETKELKLHRQTKKRK